MNVPIQVTSVPGIQISTSEFGTYSQTVTLTPVSNSVNATLWARYTPLDTTPINGNGIFAGATGAITRAIHVNAGFPAVAAPHDHCQ